MSSMEKQHLAVFVANDRYSIGATAGYAGACPWSDCEDRAALSGHEGELIELQYGRDVYTARVRGIEWYAIHRGPRQGEPIGLKVELIRA